MAGDLTYKCLGNNQYEITMEMYGDCDGALSLFYATEEIDIFSPSNCAPAFTVDLDVQNGSGTAGGTDVSQICPSQQGNTTCNGGALPGTKKYIYKKIVTMPAQCTDWVISYNKCCRNSAITNIQNPGSQDIYYAITLDNTMCNNSPVYSNIPVYYTCANQLMTYNHGVSDPDGDSLVFSLGQPLDAPPFGSTTPTPIPFEPGYTLQNPIINAGGIQLDPNLGTLCLTPNQAQISVVNMIIEEYRNGVLIGTYMREMQFVVVAGGAGCNNTSPYAGANSCNNTTLISNLNGGTSTVKAGNTIVTVCPGDPLAFDIPISDPDNDNVIALSDITTSIPGANLTYVNNGTPNVTAKFSWTPKGTDSGINTFSITAIDDACPVSGTQTYSVIIQVFEGTDAGIDTTICAGQTYEMQGSGGGNVFTWKDMSGATIPVSAEFSCNPCENPIISPTVTTTYVLTSNLAQSCKNADTVTVSVVSDFSYTKAQNTSSSCLLQDVNFGIVPDPAITGNFTYSWTPDTLLDDATLASPTATIKTPGTYNFVVEIQSPNGCYKVDSMQVNVSGSYAPNITMPDTLSACAGDTLIAAFEVVSIGVLCSEDFTGGAISCPGWTTGLSQVMAGCAGSGAQGNVLNFNGNNGDRELVSPPMDFSSGGVITFDLYAAQDFSAGCNEPESVDPFCVEYSNDGGITWITIQCFDDAALYTTFTTVTLNMPAGALTNSTQIRFIQPVGSYLNSAGNTTSYDNWAIDNISIQGNTGNAPVTFNPNTGMHQTGDSLYFYPPTSTEYTVIVTDASGGCADTAKLFIDLLEVDAGNDTTVCGTYQLNAQATGTGTFVWTPTTGLSNPNIANPTVLVTAQQMYYVQYTDVSGCVSIDSVLLTPGTLASATITTTEPACGQANGEIDFPTVSGVAPFQYSSDSGLTFTGTAPIGGLDVGSYDVVIVDASGCRLDTVIGLNNVNGPEIDSALTVATNATCVGKSDGKIKVTVKSGTGTGALEYSIDNGVTFQASSEFLNLIAGTYDIVVKDANGCEAIMQLMLGEGALKLDSIQIIDVECYGTPTGEINIIGTASSGTIEFSADSGKTYQASGMFSNLTGGVYDIVIKDVNDCEVFQKITVKDDNIFEFASIVKTPHDCQQPVCDGSATANINGGIAPITYNWSNGAGNVNAATTLCSGVYTVSAVDANNCIIDSTFVIELANPIIQTVNVTNISCFGADDGEIEIVPVNAAVNYEYTYDVGATWGGNALATNLTPGKYFIGMRDANNANCQEFQDVDIIEPDEVIATMEDTTVCFQTCADLIVNAFGGAGAPFTYAWSTGATTTTNTAQVCPTTDGETFKVTATDANGCPSLEVAAQVFFKDPLDVIVSTNDAGLCPGDTTELVANVTGGSGNYSYQWSPTTGLNSSIVQKPLANPDDSTVYYVTVTDDCGSPLAFDSVEIYVYANPVVTVFSDTTEGCQPLEVTFWDTLAHNHSSVTWSFGDGNGETKNGTEVADSVTHVYTKSGVFDVTLKAFSPLGCSIDTTIQNMINVFPKPYADFDFSPNDAKIILTEIDFEDLSKGTVIDWNWSFDSLDFSSEQNPTYIFPNDTAGIYPTTLIVEDINQCTDTVTFDVSIYSKYLVYAPTGFTPNGDQLNDFFRPDVLSLDVTKYNFRVFNRWGDIIYETDNYDDFWDGTRNGSPVPQGVYLWEVEGREDGIFKKRFVHQGHVTILR